MYTLNDQNPGIYCKTSADGEYQLYQAGEITPQTIVALQIHNLSQPEFCTNACMQLPWNEFSALKKLTIEGCNFTTFALQHDLPNLEHIEFVRSTLDGENALRILDHAGKIKKLDVSHCAQDLFGDDDHYEKFLTRVKEIKQGINSPITTTTAEEISNSNSSPLRIDTSEAVLARYQHLQGNSVSGSFNSRDSSSSSRQNYTSIHTPVNNELMTSDSGGEQFPSLAKIVYWSGDLEAQAPSMESDYTKITELYISNASQEDFDQIALSKLTKLRILNISDSYIQDLRVEKGSLQNLAILDFTDCTIASKKTIDIFIENCPGLKEIVNTDGTVFLDSDLSQAGDNVAFPSVSKKSLGRHSALSNSTTSAGSEEVRPPKNLKKAVRKKQLTDDVLPQPTPHVEADVSSIKSFEASDLDNIGKPPRRQKTQESSASLHMSSEHGVKRTASTPISLATIMYWNGNTDVDAPTTDHEYAGIMELHLSNVSEEDLSKIAFTKLTNLKVLRIYESDVRTLRVEEGCLQNLTTLDLIDCLANEEVTDSFTDNCPQLQEDLINTSGTQFLSSDLLQDDGGVVSARLSADSLKSHSASPRTTQSSFSAQKTSSRSEEMSVRQNPQSVLNERQSLDAQTTPPGDETDTVDDNSIMSFETQDLDGAGQPPKIREQEADHRSSLSQDRTSPSSETYRQHNNFSPVSSNRNSYYQASSGSKTSRYKEKLSDTRSNRSAYGHSMDVETWISTPRNTVEPRSLDQIEADIEKVLMTQCLDKHDNPLSYEIKQDTDSNGGCVRLSYEVETLLVADADSVAVYKTWNKHQTLDLPAKAMIVLGSLGMPPCPKEGIEFETGATTPLGAEVAKQFARLQQEQESDTELKISVKRP